LAKEKKLQERWERREARKEDVLRIRELEEFGSNERIRRKKAEEERELYKRELVNRDENYNHRFNRSPVVGILNPQQTNPSVKTASNPLKPPFLSSLSSSTASTPTHTRSSPSSTTSSTHSSFSSPNTINPSLPLVLSNRHKGSGSGAAAAAEAGQQQQSNSARRFVEEEKTLLQR